MKEIPILFSASMVQALLEGRKSQTRRILKDKHVLYSLDINKVISEYFKDGDGGWCPYGKPGDILWVREEFYQVGHWEPDNTRKRKSGRQAWKFVPDFHEIIFSDNPPTNFRKGRHSKDPGTSAWHKRLARFMPKSEARIRLQVNDIKVERLQDISEEDAKAEGVENINDGSFPWKHYGSPDASCVDARFSFQSLWQSINGDESWQANPWVWVISFKTLSTTGKPVIIEESSVS